MTAKKLFLFCMLLLCQIVCAQQDTIVKLKEVVVSDPYLKSFSKTQSVQVLNDSVIRKNAASLSSLLNYNSVVYFKENGLGMVSSPSFRGTTASQTAVIWNGININSQLHGQTDFNTITTRDFSSITVRSGGGSAIYGSSAIGGSIHLNNELTFKKQFSNELFLSYGSFNTLGANYKTIVSGDKATANISISRNSSDNDYEYPEQHGRRNNNGQFYNTSMNVAFGYKINAFQLLKIYSQFFESERHFSGTIASDSKNKYREYNTRNLLEWLVQYDKIKSSARVAFLSEQYQYFTDYDKPDFETSTAETFIGKYDFGYAITNRWEINSSVDYTQTKGTGESIKNATRYTSSLALMTKYRFFKNLQTEWCLRKEESNAYKSPWLFSFGMNAAVASFYNLKINVSRNFRMPTFNDLYWKFGGNPNLEPERSIQYELGHEFHGKGFRFSATAYYNDIDNLLRWKPTNGFWSPENVGSVASYGAEFLLDCERNIGAHTFKLTSTYAYTISKDKESNHQLTYVPYHKFTGGLGYSYKKLSIDYQFLFNGAVFILDDDQTILKEYAVSNISIDYHFGTKNTYSLGFRILNLADENYQNVPSRPLPGRNFNINLTIKI